MEALPSPLPASNAPTLLLLRKFHILTSAWIHFRSWWWVAESETHEGKRKKEALWPIFRIHHQRSRYVYEMYYKYKAISKEVYQYCLDEKIGDADLIAKWKKNGYEKLCCLACISSKDTAFGGTCICRVPMADRPNSKPIECSSCGCLGCASGDWKQLPYIAPFVLMRL